MSKSKTGTKHSQETKDKISKSRILRKIEQFDLQMNYLHTYNSITEASDITTILKTGISNCLNNRAKTAGSYIWKYKQ